LIEIIFRLSKLGWAQEETADLLGKHRTRITQIVSNGNITEINDFHKQHKSIYDIAD